MPNRSSHGEFEDRTTSADAREANAPHPFSVRKHIAHGSTRARLCRDCHAKDIGKAPVMRATGQTAPSLTHAPLLPPGLESDLLVMFAFAQALTCGNVHLDRLLVSLLLCSVFSLCHPVSLSVDVAMHICCVAQVASKSFGSVVLPALPSHAHLILLGHRDTRALFCAVAR